MTNICEFPYPIYDLTKNVALNRVEEGKAQMGERVRDEEVASSKKKKNELKSAKIGTLFMTKVAAKWLKSIPNI